ncbi:MAG: protein-L-isoaspartate O-methyltransferase family protein [Woeseiaceae bacterium]
MNIELARQQMVQQQVRTVDVFDPKILRVLGSVPREQFVPAGMEALAFAETELPLANGQFMMAPNIEGRMLQSLAIERSDRVLEVGTGSGFVTACLARLGTSVTSIDLFEDFQASAAANLEDSGIKNFDLQIMDAMQQLPAGEYDAIAVTGSIEEFDPRFVMALKPGGRLFIVVGTAPNMEARLVVRTGDNDWQTESLFETELPALVNGALPPQFSF